MPVKLASDHRETSGLRPGWCDALPPNLQHVRRLNSFLSILFNPVDQVYNFSTGYL